MQRHIYARWTESGRPLLFWRTTTEFQFHTAEMEFSDGFWSAHVPAAPREMVLFHLSDGDAARLPESGFHKFCTRSAYVQNGQVFAYRPAPDVEPPLRDYDAGAPIEFESQILGEKRKLRVYLPRGYRQHLDRSYPVLYVQDGQNIFERGAFGTWAAHHKLDRLTARGEIEELIVVAVDHGVGRYEDYVPPEDGGHAQLYGDFLVNELKPWVDERYRTLRGPQNTAIMGSSLGGLAALYVAWNHSDVIGKVASLSGSWWLRRWRDRLQGDTKRRLRLYLDSGDSGPANDCVQHTYALRQILGQLGYRAGEDLLYRVAQRQTHTEAAWGERVVHALRFLFPASDEVAVVA